MNPISLIGAARPGLGIAVAPERLHIAAPLGGETRTGSVLVSGGVASADVETLSAAFAALRAWLMAVAGDAAANRPVSIALLPPLVEARLIKLPPLGAAETAAVIARDARRHFLGPAEERVFAMAPRPRGSPAPVLATAAPTALVDALRAAAVAAGWRLDNIVPSPLAWAAAARAGGARCVATEVDGAVHLMNFGPAGEALSLRRLPAGDTAAIAEAVGGEPVLVSVVDPALRRRLAGDARGAAALADRGSVEGTSATGPGAGAADAAADDPATFAALFAGAAPVGFVTATAVATHRADGIRSAARLATAAVLLVAAAGALEFWGVQRELAAVSERRRALAGDLPELLELSDSLNAIEERRAAIRSLASGAPAVTPALLDVALRLPGDTYLTSLRANGDSLTFDAVGGAADRALSALQDGASLTDVRLRGNVQRELREGGRPLERFTVDARIEAVAATASGSGVEPAAMSGAPGTSRPGPSTRADAAGARAPAPTRTAATRMGDGSGPRGEVAP